MPTEVMVTIPAVHVSTAAVLFNCFPAVWATLDTPRSKFLVQERSSRVVSYYVICLFASSLIFSTGSLVVRDVACVDER